MAAANPANPDPTTMTSTWLESRASFFILLMHVSSISSFLSDQFISVSGIQNRFVHFFFLLEEKPCRRGAIDDSVLQGVFYKERSVFTT